MSKNKANRRKARLKAKKQQLVLNERNLSVRLSVALEKFCEPILSEYIDDSTPWSLAKDESKKDILEEVIYSLLEVIRCSAILLENIMPNSSKAIYKFLNIKETNYENLVYGLIDKYSNLSSEVLFKRLDVEKDVLSKVLKKEEKQEEQNNLISIDDFSKVNLVVGEIVEANEHPNASKLMVLKVNIGKEVRQIVSGIREYYEPKDLIGKKVCVVTNLAPIKLRGVESNGMICCAGKKAKLVLIPDGEVGEKIS